MKTSELTIAKAAVVEEFEEINVPQEEPETIGHLDAKMPSTKFQSSDGHMFHTDRDIVR